MGVQHHCWRDCHAWKEAGLQMSTTSNEAAKLYDACVTQYNGIFNDKELGGLSNTLKLMTEADPTFVMGKVVKLGLEMLGGGARTRRHDSNLAQDIGDLIKLADDSNTLERERKHVEAVELWSYGHLDAATRCWQDILLTHPHDLLALRFCYDNFFYLGKPRELRDTVARVLPHWNDTMPMYSYLLGMYAFGLVETNFYTKAEEYGRKGIFYNPYDGWATHSLAHVFEMENRTQEGIKFMGETESYWNKCDSLLSHIFWHWALYYVEKGDYDAALNIYETNIRKLTTSTDVMPIVDTTSLLFRLEMEGVHIGEERWEHAYEVCRPHVDDHISVYHDIHFAMGYVGAKKIDFADTFVKSVKDYIDSESGNVIHQTYKDFGLKMIEAIVAYGDGDYASATDTLDSVRYNIFSMGGSNAQLDVLHQLLVHSAMKSNNPKHHRLSRNLIFERQANNPNSELNDRLLKKCMAMHGE